MKIVDPFLETIIVFQKKKKKKKIKYFLRYVYVRINCLRNNS